MKQQTSFADFSEYMLALSLHRGERRGGVKGGEEHQVRLLVFTSWYEPQLSRDPHPLLELQRRLGTQREPYNETLLVHCENGCGRTAVFIALDILMATYASKREVSGSAVTFFRIQILKTAPPFLEGRFSVTTTTTTLSKIKQIRLGHSELGQP